MFRSVSLKAIALGAVALSGFAMAPSDASADGWRHRGHGHHRGHYYAPRPRAYYAPPPRAYYYAPPRYVYAPPPRPRHWGYHGPRPYYRY